MADGSVHFFQQTVAPRVLEALATAAGREEIGAEW
jgi:hypothetical protein